MTNVKSLLEMYVKMGGSLTDTYADIAGGVPVGQYSTISDAILACSKKYSAGGGGGAEKFVVTLTQESDTWTADKTIAEIVAADEAGKIVVAKYPNSGMYVDLPLSSAVEYQGIYGALFIGFVNSGNDNKIVSVQCTNQGSGDVIATTEQPIPTSSSAPLIVTLTAGQEAGRFVGDKTNKEVYDALTAGQSVIMSAGVGSATFKLAVQYASFDGTDYEFAFIDSSAVKNTVSGGANDYVTASLA